MRFNQAMKEIMKQKRKEALDKTRLDNCFRCNGCGVYYQNLPKEMIVNNLCHLCQPKSCVGCETLNECEVCGVHLQN